MSSTQSLVALMRADFFAGGFDGEGELLTRGLLDQKLPSADKRPYSVVIGLRSSVFEAFRDLERPGLGLTRTPNGRSR